MPYSNQSLPSIPKDNAFNAIRLLLCLVVVFMHTLGNLGIQNRFLLDGHMAVCGFFIISGFWVTKSYFCSKSLKEFFAKRAKKILPMYYFSVVGFSLLCVLFSSASPREYFGLDYAKYLFWNSIFLNFARPYLPNCFEKAAVNGALWTIKVEIGFYLILPLLIYAWQKLNTSLKKNLFFACLYALSVAYNLLMTRYATKLHLPAQMAHQLPAFISFFASGMWIFLNWELFLKIKNKLIIPAIILYFVRYKTGTEILFPAAFALIIVWAALFFKGVSFIGCDIDFSYGIYLFHFPIMQILFYSANKQVNVFTYVASVLALSFSLTYIIETLKKRRK